MKPDEHEAVDWEAIAARINNDDEDAVGHFATEFGLRLRRFFVLRGLRSPDAEDLAVDTIADVVLGVRQGRFKPVGPGSFVGWCYTIARHKLTDHFRSRRDVPLSESNSVVARAADSARNTPNASALLQTVRTTLDSMTDQHREILLIRHSSLGGTFGEIASILGISEEAARRRYHRARDRLAKELTSIPSLREWLEKSTSQNNPIAKKENR